MAESSMAAWSVFIPRASRLAANYMPDQAYCRRPDQRRTELQVEDLQLHYRQRIDQESLKPENEAPFLFGHLSRTSTCGYGNSMAGEFALPSKTTTIRLRRNPIADPH
jgi:hypothetical protein